MIFFMIILFGLNTNYSHHSLLSIIILFSVSNDRRKKNISPNLNDHYDSKKKTTKYEM